MTLNRLLYRNLIWRGFFYFTSFVLNIVMVRALGAELSGRLYFFLNNVAFAALIGSISFESGITYYISKQEIPENSVATFSFVWASIVAIVISVSFFFLYNDKALFGSPFIMFACLSFTIGNLLQAYFNAFFYSCDNYRTPNLIIGSLNIILLFFIPWTSNWLGFIDLKTFLIIFFIGNFLQGFLVCLFWILYKKKFFFHDFSFRQIQPVLKYSLTAFIGNVAYFILYRVDYWFVEYYCTSKSLGNYIQVSRIGQLLVLPFVIVAGALFPQAAKSNFSFETKLFKKLIWIIIITYLLAEIFIWLCSRWIILFLWGNDFNEMYEPLMIITPGIFFLAISNLFAPTFAGKGKVKYNVVISIMSLIVVVVCNFFWVPIWGIKGAAWATTIGFLTMAALYFIITRLKFQFSFRNLFR